MSIQVHPKRGFLNIDILITNHGEDKVQLSDKLTGDNYELGPGVHLLSKFSAGEHVLEGVSNDGAPIRLKFTVEDALKFGGSSLKRYFVFDETPWMFIVMKDRTYFFNRETKEEFVEHSFSPDEIVCMNDRALLLTNGSDNSIFSLEEMDVVRSFHESETVFYNGDSCILEQKGKLILCDISRALSDNSFREIDVDHYSVDKQKNVLFYTTGGKKLTIQRQALTPVEEGGPLDEPQSITIPQPFVCFVQPSRVVMAESPMKLLIMRLDRQIPVVLYEGFVPMSSVNGEEIWDNKVYDQLLESDCDTNGFTQKNTLKVFYRGERRYTQTKRVFLFRQGKHYELKSKWSFEGDKIHLDSDVAMNISHKEVCDYFVFEGKTYAITNSGIRIFDGDLLSCETDGTAIVVKKEDNDKESFLTLGRNEIPNPMPHQNWSYLVNGFIQLQDNEFGPSLYWPVTNKTYAGQKWDSIIGGRIVHGIRDIPDRFFMYGGQIVPVPVKRELVAAVSKTGETVLTKDNDKFGFAVHKGGEWTVSNDDAFTLYDYLQVEDAVFCGDGKSFVYKTEQGMVLHDMDTGNESSFPENVEVMKNINGYKTFIDWQPGSKPVFVDPVTHQRVSGGKLSSFTFSNAEGTLHYKCRRHKRFFRNEGDELTDEQYAALCQEYNAPEMTEALVEKRRSLYLRIRGSIGPFHNNWNKLFFEACLNSNDFLDSEIVEVKEYIVIERFGEEVEICIGRNLWFLNYVAFSSDCNSVIISAKYRDASGLCLVYDFSQGRITHSSFDTKAVWRGIFSSVGDAAYYDSTPDTYMLKYGTTERIEINGRSFLTFSPSGKYLALSRQGYIPGYGHQPSCDVYIAKTDSPKNELAHYADHGSSIKHVRGGDNVACASFSSDERKLLTVGADGVVVVRYLNL